VLLPKTSIVVSTYNRPDALRKCVESIFLQTQLPNEIVIADDGSENETRLLVEQLVVKSPVKLVHVWQEDNGYQLAMIRNRSFVAASGEYIIQVDGDLVFEENFIRDHLKVAKHGTFVGGARVMMDQELTKLVLDDKVSTGEIPSYKEHLGLTSNALRSQVLSKLAYVYQRHPRNYKYVLGCNMAFWKRDLVKVNGYDESFEGWGKEDNELAVRLQNAEIRLRFIKFGAVCYHLYHPVADLSYMSKNEERLMRTIKDGSVFAKLGMSNYLKDH
jgi:glycosyltransferase involved in cell wall biosynthesis